MTPTEIIILIATVAGLAIDTSAEARHWLDRRDRKRGGHGNGENQ